jgi:carbamoyltransferase|tara:strand:- start:5808 stop:7628 length:1821 start_codon:yes stop_codon:yes gene_type:complete
MYILGISAFYHDSAATLIDSGKIIAAAQEERFSRIKFDDSFPFKAIEYCLQEANIALEDLDCIAFYENTHLKFDRIIRSYIKYLPKSFSIFRQAMKLWIKEKLFCEKLAYEQLGWEGKEMNVLHHISHSASAFFPSPFEEAAILVMDGVGEWACTSIGVGKGNKIKLIKEISYPNSLGILYSGFTQYVGFKVNSGEYKMMGLAPYGTPRYKNLILDKIINVREDGSYKLNLHYFDFHHGYSTINEEFEILFGARARKPDEEIREIDIDIAASIQTVLEEVILKLAWTAKGLTGMEYLVIAGGVGLNCTANGRLLEQRYFKDIWVQPAAGDAGGSLGAALYTYFQLSKGKREKGMFEQAGSLFGPCFSDEEIEHALRLYGVRYKTIASDEAFFEKVSDYIAEDKIVGWFQGKMEFGPRALGNRSILGNPKSPTMQSEMNLKIKYRESFRPFAPVVLEESVKEYFDVDRPMPYMLFIVKVKKDQRIDVGDERIKGLESLHVIRSTIPAVTHVDYSARIQTVSEHHNPKFYRLLKTYNRKTGCPVLINTSFNVRSEPIVCTPEDAIRCFLASEIDVLAIGHYLVTREDQNWSITGRAFLEPEHFDLSCQ